MFKYLGLQEQILIRNTWFFTYHHNPKEKWSLPRGFAEELEKQKVKLIRKEVNDPNMMILPTAKEIEAKNISVVLIFYAGRNYKLNESLIKCVKIYENQDKLKIF